MLGFSEVGARDNFFDLGGNSLLGVDLIARIRNEFQLPTIPGHLLYQAPTIATMSGWLTDDIGMPDVIANRSRRGAARRRNLEQRR